MVRYLLARWCLTRKKLSIIIKCTPVSLFHLLRRGWLVVARGSRKTQTIPEAIEKLNVWGTRAKSRPSRLQLSNARMRGCCSQLIIHTCNVRVARNVTDSAPSAEVLIGRLSVNERRGLNTKRSSCQNARVPILWWIRKQNIGNYGRYWIWDWTFFKNTLTVFVCWNCHLRIKNCLETCFLSF